MTKQTYDFLDGNGPVAAHKHPNGGGWVADSATVAETAYVGLEAKVYGYAKVFSNARVFGDARVYGNAEVSDNAKVFSNAKVTRTPITVNGFPYQAVITDHHITIGCQQHTYQVWRAEGLDIIQGEGYSESQAKRYLKLMLMLAEEHGCDKPKE